MNAKPLKNKSNFRTRHRDAAHAEAHAHAQAAAPIPEHPLVCRDQAAVIRTDDELKELIVHLRHEGVFAYDSEFIGEMTYIPRLCVIQVATARRIALVDPLAEVDLQPFWELLADPEVEKIVHAGQQDIEPVWRHTGGPGRKFFDTQIAAGFLGMVYPVSLSRLVQAVMGVKLGKGMTFSHWDQRPLSPMQRRYAADDVRYLPAVHAELSRQLEQAGHRQWAWEEFDAMAESAAHRFDPETQYLKIRGASSFSARQMALLRALTIWRDQSARKHDLPPRSFLRDDVLAELARSPIRAVEDLSSVKGLPRPIEQEYGSSILETTARVLNLPADQLPRLQPQDNPSPRQRFNADALWAAFQCLCAGRRIDPALVASHQEVTAFQRNPGQSSIMRGWRREAVGQPLSDLVRGQKRLSLRWNDRCMQGRIEEA